HTDLGTPPAVESYAWDGSSLFPWGESLGPERARSEKPFWEGIRATSPNGVRSETRGERARGERWTWPAAARRPASRGAEAAERVAPWPRQRGPRAASSSSPGTDPSSRYRLRWRASQLPIRRSCPAPLPPPADLPPRPGRSAS